MREKHQLHRLMGTAGWRPQQPSSSAAPREANPLWPRGSPEGMAQRRRMLNVLKDERVCVTCRRRACCEVEKTLAERQSTPNTGFFSVFAR